MNIRKSIIMSAPVLFLALILSSFSLGYTGVFAEGNTNECTDAQDTGYNLGTENERIFSTPSGELVDGVCIKSGSNMFDDGHSSLLGNGVYEDGCYEVTGVGTEEVTVKTLKDGDDCQGISHLDIYYSQAQPTPTVEPTPTEVEPTPTETEEEPTPTPTEVEPTVTPVPTSTPTPTPTGNVEGTSDSNDDPGDPADPAPAPEGQVLGASTLADTGVDSSSLYALGLILIGIAAYGFSAPKILQEA